MAQLEPSAVDVPASRGSSDAAVAAAHGNAGFDTNRTRLPARDLIIIDDPLKPEEALSQAQHPAANGWYDHTLYSRLNDKFEG